jgi:hypothetical protein
MAFVGADAHALGEARAELDAAARRSGDAADWFSGAAALSGLLGDPEWGGTVDSTIEHVDQLTNTARQTAELLDAVREGLADVHWFGIGALAAIRRELVDVELASLGIEPDEEHSIDRVVAANRIRIRADLEAATDDDRRRLLQSWLDPTVDAITGEMTVPQVLLYDGSLGRVAIAFGGVTTADDVLVTVPGTGTTLDAYRLGDSFGLEARRAVLLREKVNDVGGDDVAVIAWLGYDAPQWIAANNPGTSGAGERGGLLLHDFVDGLVLRPTQRLTVVGHSYGSFVVGEALSDGLAPHNTIVLGSPGMGVDHVGDFELPEGSDVFAMRATMDPVGTLERFGMSPTSVFFGADRLQAHTDTFVFSHSDYWSDANLTQIARAAIDGAPETQRFTSVGDVVHESVMAPVAVADDIVDQLQRPLPGFAEDVVDDLQTTGRTMVGTASTIVVHGIDAGINATVEATEWTGDRLSEAADAITFWD